jgi:hypothetical protein
LIFVWLFRIFPLIRDRPTRRPVNHLANRSTQMDPL